jgi:hypothetical protein
MIVEIEFEGQFYYVKAQIPPDNLEDMTRPTSREDLLDTLKNVTPHHSSILRPITRADVYGGGKTKFDPNTFKIEDKAYDDLQEFDWQQIMSFAAKM